MSELIETEINPMGEISNYGPRESYVDYPSIGNNRAMDYLNFVKTGYDYGKNAYDFYHKYKSIPKEVNKEVLIEHDKLPSKKRNRKTLDQMKEEFSKTEKKFHEILNRKDKVPNKIHKSDYKDLQKEAHTLEGNVFRKIQRRKKPLKRQHKPKGKGKPKGKRPQKLSKQATSQKSMSYVASTSANYTERCFWKTIGQGERKKTIKFRQLVDIIQTPAVANDGTIIFVRDIDKNMFSTTQLNADFSKYEYVTFNDFKTELVPQVGANSTGQYAMWIEPDPKDTPNNSVIYDWVDLCNKHSARITTLWGNIGSAVLPKTSRKYYTELSTYNVQQAAEKRWTSPGSIVIVAGPNMPVSTKLGSLFISGSISFFDPYEESAAITSYSYNSFDDFKVAAGQEVPIQFYSTINPVSTATESLYSGDPAWTKRVNLGTAAGCWDIKPGTYFVRMCVFYSSDLGTQLPVNFTNGGGLYHTNEIGCCTFSTPQHTYPDATIEPASHKRLVAYRLATTASIPNDTIFHPFDTDGVQSGMNWDIGSTTPVHYPNSWPYIAQGIIKVSLGDKYAGYNYCSLGFNICNHTAIATGIKAISFIVSSIDEFIHFDGSRLTESPVIKRNFADWAITLKSMEYESKTVEQFNDKYRNELLNLKIDRSLITFSQFLELMKIFDTVIAADSNYFKVVK